MSKLAIVTTTLPAAAIFRRKSNRKSSTDCFSIFSTDGPVEP